MDLRQCSMLNVQQSQFIAMWNSREREREKEMLIAFDAMNLYPPIRRLFGFHRKQSKTNTIPFTNWCDALSNIHLFSIRSYVAYWHWNFCSARKHDFIWDWQCATLLHERSAIQNIQKQFTHTHREKKRK